MRYRYKISYSNGMDKISPEEWLNRCASQGWELVTALREGIQFTFILRREMSPSENY